MAIDLNKEELLSPTEATKVLPKRLSSNCIWRWARKGVRGVQLEYVRPGRRIFISREALARFAQRLAEADETARMPTARWDSLWRRPRVRTALQRQRDIEEAKRRLDAAGI